MSLKIKDYFTKLKNQPILNKNFYLERFGYLGWPLLLMLIFFVIKHPLIFDITKLKNNSLNESSKILLSKLDKDLQIKLVTTDIDIRNQVQTIITLFQKENPHIRFQVENSLLSPQEKKALQLQSNHNLLFSLEDQTKALDLDKLAFTEQTFTQLLYQMMRHKEDWIVFLSGHGEMDPIGSENWQMGRLNKTLKNTGLNISTLKFNESGLIPDNTQVLVIADNQKPLLPKEVEHILNYVKRGGNLLWLVNPGSHPNLEPLAKALGVSWQEGVILDPKAHKMGTPHSAVSIITNYPTHPITKNLDTLSVFPWARPIEFADAEKFGWDAKPFLLTSDGTRLKKERIKGVRKRNIGPFTIGLTLQKAKQRVAIIGNSHFLNNSTIHNNGNQALAKNLFNWLSEADFLLDNQIPPKVAQDIFFFDTPFVHFTREYAFPYLLPLVYLLVGWQLRRQRYRYL